MPNREVVINLWYVTDQDGLIYSLRVKAYVDEGTDGQKLGFLQQRALLDYLVAEPFEVPPRFHVRIPSGHDSEVMPVAHVMMLKTLDTPIALFEDALKVIESRFPAQSELGIPQRPVFCVTPLVQNGEGVIEPLFSGQMRY